MWLLKPEWYEIADDLFSTIDDEQYSLLTCQEQEMYEWEDEDE